CQPRSSRARAAIAAASGLRQVFPVQTKRMLYVVGSLLLSRRSSMAIGHFHYVFDLPPPDRAGADDARDVSGAVDDRRRERRRQLASVEHPHVRWIAELPEYTPDLVRRGRRLPAGPVRTGRRDRLAQAPQNGPDRRMGRR